MNVLIVNNFYDPNVFGGGERSVQFLAEGLASLGQSVSVMTLALDGVARTQAINGVEVHYVNVGNLGATMHKPDRTLFERIAWHVSAEMNLRTGAAFRSLARRVDADLVHTNNLPGFSTSVWRESRKLKIPVVHTLRTYFLMCARMTMYRASGNCERQCGACRGLTQRRRRHSDDVEAVVGNSEFILNRHLASGYFSRASERAVVFSGYSAADDEVSGHTTAESRELRIGYIGRLHPTKGVEDLLQALRRIDDRCWQLRVAGKGTPDYERRLQDMMLDTRIEFLGWTDAASFFRGIDLLVVPSLWHEPLPRTIFESYAHGVPVIASNRGGNPEAVSAGETGWIYDPGRPGTLRELLRSALVNPSGVRSMRAACLKAAAEFAPERCARGYLDVYRRASKKNGTREARSDALRASKIVASQTTGEITP